MIINVENQGRRRLCGVKEYSTPGKIPGVEFYTWKFRYYKQTKNFYPPPPHPVSVTSHLGKICSAGPVENNKIEKEQIIIA